MKYMNNHYGQSRIFDGSHCKIPMNLQTFAESGDAVDAGAGGGTDSNGENSGNDSVEEGDTPSVEELVAQLAAERARSAKLQNEKDNASTEAANYKKQLRAKMTSDEQAEAAKAEAVAAKDALIAELQAERRINIYSKRFMGVGMEEQSATEIAGLIGEIADVDKFFSALDKFIKAVSKKAGESAVETLIKNNPSVKAGNGGADENETAFEMARASAGRTSEANMDILKHYIAGGKR